MFNCNGNIRTMRKIGKIGRANIEARKKIAEIAQEFDLCSCEARLDGCMGTFGIAPAHRNKREHYGGDVEKLSDYNEWIACCQFCHQKIEGDRELTEKVFKRLRG